MAENGKSLSEIKRAVTDRQIIQPSPGPTSLVPSWKGLDRAQYGPHPVLFLTFPENESCSFFSLGSEHPLLALQSLMGFTSQENRFFNEMPPSACTNEYSVRRSVRSLTCRHDCHSLPKCQTNDFPVCSCSLGFAGFLWCSAFRAFCLFLSAVFEFFKILLWALQFFFQELNLLSKQK